MSLVQLFTSLLVVVAVTAVLLLVIEGRIDPAKLATNSAIAFVAAAAVRFVPNQRGSR